MIKGSEAHVGKKKREIKVNDVTNQCIRNIYIYLLQFDFAFEFCKL